MSSLRICTYNIHKGFSQFNRRLAIHDLRDRLRLLGPDMVFLQEVQGCTCATPAPRGLAGAAPARVPGPGCVAADGLRRQRHLRPRPSRQRHPELATPSCPRPTRTSPITASRTAACCHCEIHVPGGPAGALRLRPPRAHRRQPPAPDGALVKRLDAWPRGRAADHRRRLQRLAQPRRRLLAEQLGVVEVFVSAFAAAGAQFSQPPCRCCASTASMCAASPSTRPKCTTASPGVRSPTTPHSPAHRPR
jgi:hypothetical protein